MEENTNILNSEPDLIDITKNTIFDLQQIDDETIEEINRNIAQNLSLTDTDVHIYGDRTVIAQVIQLLSYIRHAVKNNMDTQIIVKFGKEIANAEFTFDVNGCEIPDLIPPAETEIN